MALNGRVFCVMVKPLPDTDLTMAILSDITESRQIAKRREDFFANASHEFKTPLTVLKGFNELTALNNKDESINKYINGIARETDRMLSLIGDMLKLSELENTQVSNLAVVSLASTVNKVYKSVSAAVNEKAIIFESVGDGTVTAEPGTSMNLSKC